MIFPENVNNIPPISDNNNIPTLSKNKNKADKYLDCLYRPLHSKHSSLNHNKLDFFNSHRSTVGKTLITLIRTDN